MTKTIAFAVAALLPAFLFAQTAPAPKGAPSADTAGQVLKDSPRHGEYVEIPAGDAKVKTWVVYPERKDKAPVVIVIHEIFGMTDWVRAVADELAANGFIAVAPDLLSGKGPNGGGTESLGSDVRSAIQKLSPDEVAQRLDAVRAYGVQLPAATNKTATIGFCWGGSQSFAYATRRPELNGAVVYYGTAPKDKEQLAKIQCPVLGLYGGNDARVTATVEPTEKAMKEAGKAYAPHTYENAGHGFLRQQSGQNGANQKAADQAWAETVTFLKKNLESAK
jgi:carboxymethylenebutenolidase